MTRHTSSGQVLATSWCSSNWRGDFDAENKSSTHLSVANHDLTRFQSTLASGKPVLAANLSFSRLQASDTSAIEAAQIKRSAFAQAVSLRCNSTSF